MKKVKSVKGITLVALVITIIILLILAGISISSLTNQGLFEKAKEAKQQTENAQKEENEKLGNYIEQIYAIELKNVDKTKTNPEAAMPSGASIVEADADKGIVIKDSENNEWTWVEVPKNIFENAQGINDYANIEKDLISYATEYRKGNWDQNMEWKDEWYDGCGIKTTQEYTEIYNKMLSSVYKNGGFWISRYEIGDSTATEKNETRTSESGINRTPVSKPNQIPYNYVTCSEAQSIASKITTDSSKTSSLLFGIQWDLTCKFLQEKGKLKIEDINKESKCGNYYNKSLTLYRGKYNIKPWIKTSEWISYNVKTDGYVVDSKTSENESYRQLLTTGASEDTNKMNIYDFAGNEWEWTLEHATSGQSGPCTERGGMYGNQYVISSAYRYGNTITQKNEGNGFRATLY